MAYYKARTSNQMKSNKCDGKRKIDKTRKVQHTQQLGEVN